MNSNHVDRVSVELLRQEILQQKESEYTSLSGVLATSMREFTISLHLLLISEGYHNKHTLPKWYPGFLGIPGGYASGIDITLGRGRAHITIHPLLKRLMSLNTVIHPRNIDDLLHELHEMRHGCGECKYSNDTLEFCGRGLTLRQGCTSFVPWAGPYQPSI